jgi:hypothetical protein
MAKRNYRDLFIISRSGGVYLELFSKILGASCKYVDCGLIMEKGRGLNEKWLKYSIFILFSNRK